MSPDPLYSESHSNCHRTLFWGGDTFAPKLLVKDSGGSDVSIQQFLQNAFLNMFELLAQAVGDLDGVLGFEVSYIRLCDITSTHSRLTDDE